MTPMKRIMSRATADQKRGAQGISATNATIATISPGSLDAGE
jgi:hypothetical protein